VTPDAPSCRTSDGGEEPCIVGGETRPPTGAADNSNVDLDVDGPNHDPVQVQLAAELPSTGTDQGFSSVSLASSLTSSPRCISMSNMVERHFYDPDESVDRSKEVWPSPAPGAGPTAAESNAGDHRVPPANDTAAPQPGGTLGSTTRLPATPVRPHPSGIPRLLRGRPSTTALTETTNESVDELVRDFLDKKSASKPRRREDE